MADKKSPPRGTTPRPRPKTTILKDFEYLPGVPHVVGTTKGMRTREVQLKKKAFLETLPSTDGRITEALKLVGATYGAYEHWRRNDQPFAEAVKIVLEQCVEQIRDRDRTAVADLIALRHPQVVGKAMERLPEYEKRATVKHEGTIQHQHYELSPQETLELLEHAKAAIELQQDEDGTFE